MNEISPVDIDHVIDEIVDTIVSEYKDCPKCGLPRNAENWTVVRGERV